MDPNHCPLCGLETADPEDHATSTHGLNLDAVDAILRAGRKDLADSITALARDHGANPADLATPARSRAMAKGGYL